MNRWIGTTTAAAILAIAASGAAKADLVETDICNAVSTNDRCAGGTGLTVVYRSFTFDADTTVAGFRYYSYFDGSTYASTNWWIYKTGSSTAVESGNTAGTVESSSLDPALVEVDISDFAMEAGVTYWIGLQNVLTDRDGYSVYAATDPNINVGDTFVSAALDDGTSFAVGETEFFSQAAVDIVKSQGLGGGLRGVDVPSAPEPSTWAMMLAGFAAMAWAARRGAVRPAV